jgi:hypothetical protein
MPLNAKELTVFEMIMLAAPSEYPSAGPSVYSSGSSTSEATFIENPLYMAIPSILSAIGAGTIVLSFVVFRKELLKKAYMEVLFYIALSNLLTSVGSSIGIPPDGSGLCWFQGVVTNIFSLSGCLWTMVIPILLLKVLNNKNDSKKSQPVPLSAHILCWGIPLIATFIPLVNATYGSPEGGWCWIVETNRTPAWGLEVWFWVSFYGWIWMTMVTLLCQFVYILYKLQGVSTNTAESFRPVFYDLGGYVIIIFICWLTPCVSDFMLSDTETPGYAVLQILGSILPCSMGLLGAVLFWSRNSKVRNKWLVVFRIVKASAIHRGSQVRRSLGSVRVVPVESNVSIGQTIPKKI